MYAKNTIAKRRASGWVERRRYIQHLLERARISAQKDEKNEKVVPTQEKD